jgi:hypothetical protein
MRLPPEAGGAVFARIQPGATFPLAAQTYYHRLPMRV